MVVEVVGLAGSGTLRTGENEATEGDGGSRFRSECQPMTSSPDAYSGSLAPERMVARLRMVWSRMR